MMLSVELTASKVVVMSSDAETNHFLCKMNREYFKYVVDNMFYYIWAREKNIYT